MSEILRDPEKLMNYLQALAEHQQHAAENEEWEEETIDWTFEEGAFGHDFTDQTQFSPSTKGLEFFNTTEISKLYRQLAKQLHPDKSKTQHKKPIKKN
ncbi:hypothetical protein P4S72_06880 [Vibrio sp. PP-XX7]